MSNRKIPKRQKIREIQEKLKKDKVIMDYDVDELKYLQKPIGSALYDYGASSSDDYADDYESEDYESEDYDFDPGNSSDYHSEENQFALDSNSSSESSNQTTINQTVINSSSTNRKKKAQWNDRLVCKICGGEYTRSAVTAHRKTNKHKIYEKAGKKFLNILRGD